ncbi:Amidohydrolase 3 [Hymenobacter roseosalivarius DSM 11622]|uniref:Amidohydrolase 3 n=1 Tax=Hymenobacter roseosalivarius DSM 11622 TaxID=645990 RepID=A0A1W1W579_9BACT|nr:amidohydrolase [Hymenobacter roseosalivarius]SMC00541.1 Amidohydrolase 3 [Hymenobacter roseosalivarius DSM 11622]
MIKLLRPLSLLLPLLAGFNSCQNAPQQQAADLVVYNATVYTVDSAFSKAQAFAVQDGKFLAVGTADEIRQKYKGKQEVDAGGQFIYPGFYDAHCHFYRYALGLRYADLVGTTSWGDVVSTLQRQRQQYPQAAWLIGRGWDQNDWPTKQFPTKDTLDKLFPNVPVLITRVDGHAAIVNQKALDLAGITTRTPVSGGVIGRDAIGQLTGLLVDNAVDLVSAKIPEPSATEANAALLQAQQLCVAVGLTSLADAGLDKANIDQMEALQKQGKLKLRLYAMLNPTAANKEFYFKNGLIETDRLTVRSFKVYADGALGSRGACLVEPYQDRPKETGFLLSTEKEYRALAKEIAASKFQMNTHAIGDSANRIILNIYGEALKGQKDRRWRIEHAQVITPADMGKFGQFGIVPSVQPTHATSDMYWAGERLGPERVKTAYAFEELRKQYGQVALGSDFPVEDINPLFGFHSAVARQDAKNYPEGGFQPENALSRPDALRGMTTWAAHAAFEEKQKGSIQPGMAADFVVLNKDLLTAPAPELRGAQVQQTWIAGEQVFSIKK